MGNKNQRIVKFWVICLIFLSAIYLPILTQKYKLPKQQREKIAKASIEQEAFTERDNYQVKAQEFTPVNQWTEHIDYCSDFVSNGKYAYAIAGRNILVVNLTTTNENKLYIGSILSTVYSIASIAIVENVLFVSVTYDKLYVFNVSSPLEPELIDDFNFISSQYIIHFSFTNVYGFFTTNLNYLYIFDISNLNDILVVEKHAYQNFISGSLNIQKTKVCNQILYIYDQLNNSVLFCNITDIASPKYITNCSIKQKIVPLDFDVDNDILIITNRWFGFTIFNITDKYHPIKKYDYNESAVIDFITVSIKENFVYFGSNKMLIYNISDITNPEKIAFNNTVLFVNYFHYKNDLLLCFSYDYRLFVIDLSIPHNPIILADKPFVTRVTDVLYQGNYLFVTTKEHRMIILNASNIEKISFVSEFYFQWDMQKIMLHNDLAFLFSNLHKQIIILNISKVASPQLISIYNCTGKVYSLEYYNKNAYIVNEYGLEIVDFSDLYSPVKIAEYSSFVSDVYTIAIVNNYSFLAGPAHITILDISNLQTIQKVDEEFFSGFVGTATKIVSNRLFVVGLNPLLSIFDISNPNEVNLIGSFDITPSVGATDIEIDRYYAYLATSYGCYVVDFQDTKNIRLVAQNSVVGFSTLDIGTDGKLYGSVDQSGIYVFDLLTTKPSKIGSLSLISFIPLVVITNLSFICIKSITSKKNEDEQ